MIVSSVLHQTPSDSPGFGKVCPEGHHVPWQRPLCLRVLQGGPGPQGVAEHVGDLVPVHDPGPGGPRRVLRPVAELVEEDPGNVEISIVQDPRNDYPRNCQPRGGQILKPKPVGLVPC